MIEEILKLKDADEDIELLAKYIATTNTKQFTLTKLAEECVELSDVCLKMVNKKEQFAPKRTAFWEEISDVTMRIELYRQSLTEKEQDELDEFIMNRFDKKFNKFLTYIKEGKYQGGI